MPHRFPPLAPPEPAPRTRLLTLPQLPLPVTELALFLLTGLALILVS